MPIYCSHIRIMLFKDHLLLGCWHIKDSCCSIVRTSRKFDGTHRTWEITNAGVGMGTEPVLLNDHIVTVKYISLFISCYKEFLIISPCHCLDTVFMYITATEVLKVSSIPNDDFAFIRAGHYLLAIFHPLHLVQWYLMFVLTLPYKVSASHIIPIFVVGLTSRITFIWVYVWEVLIICVHVFWIWIVGVNAWSILLIEVIVLLKLGIVNIEVWVFEFVFMVLVLLRVHVHHATVTILTKHLWKWIHIASSTKTSLIFILVHWISTSHFMLIYIINNYNQRK